MFFHVADDLELNVKKVLIIVLVTVIISVLIFVSYFLSSWYVADISVLPAILSLVLLVPLYIWLKNYRGQKVLSSQNPDRKTKRKTLIEVFSLFLLSLGIRIPFVLFSGMAYEKTVVIYLIVLAVVWGLKMKMSDFGFRTEHFLKSLLIGAVYFLALTIPMFMVSFTLVYVYTGQLLITGYSILSLFLIFPFMTFCVGISEEGLFRGFIQVKLEGIYNERKALLIQALLFGAWHFIWHVAPFDLVGMSIHIFITFIFGLLFGQFFKVGRNLVPIILAHGLVDTIGYVAILNPELSITDGLVQNTEIASYIIGFVILALSTKFLAKKAKILISNDEINTSNQQ
jgi:membrane protease YdiL (CAAX protease family)